MQEIERFTVLTERYLPSDPRLGRHVRHDSRSLNYLVEAESVDSLKSIRHIRRIPILDQGNVGSCTGNAGVGCLGTEPFYDTIPNIRMTLNEQLANQFYSEATKIDPYPGTYPPTDTGSDGLSIAKVLQNNKLISGYLHATSLEAALTALSKQPVIVGTKWMSGMFSTTWDGRLNISGSLAGGHEYELDQLDVENRRIWIDNSWGSRWGVQGRAYMTWDDFGALLQDNGDVTVFVPITQPAPVPVPPKPPVPPAPVDPKVEFADAFKTFLTAATKFFGQ